MIGYSIAAVSMLNNKPATSASTGRKITLRNKSTTLFKKPHIINIELLVYCYRTPILIDTDNYYRYDNDDDAIHSDDNLVKPDRYGQLLQV